MSDALVEGGKPQGSRALELLSRGVGGLENKGAIVKALLPNLPQLHLPFNRPPPNIIRVVLDERSKCPSPGDTICGTIRLMVSEPIAVRDIAVSLTGFAKAKSLRSTGQSFKMIYRSDIQLLNETVEIDPGTAVLAPKRYEWPFELGIPRTCTIAKLPFDENTRRFNSNLIQPLPPIFTDKNQADVRSKCSIGYYVTAKLVLKRQNQRDVQHEVPISIVVNDKKALMASDTNSTLTKRCTFKFRSGLPSTPSSSPSKYPTTDKKTSSAAEPAENLPSPSLGTKFKTSFLPFTLSRYTFDIDATLPRSGRLSNPLSISLKIFWHVPSSVRSAYGVTRPSLSLKSATVSVLRRTLMRAMPEDDNINSGFVIATGSLHQIWRSEPVVVAELKEPIEELPDSLDLSKHIFIRPHHFQPAFRTFNIAREYVLQVVCQLESCDENFEARFEVEQFAILTEDGADDDFEGRRRLNREEQDALRDLESDAEDIEGDDAQLEHSTNFSSFQNSTAPLR
ncbi:MAG: hypothetical protein LQ340_001649 [Diploschistes diacapsis]|nr:MAG: hypothetical protein LQ340_001649 [Diploschistes diacapsis]